jgi:hypothetical protein
MVGVVNEGDSLHGHDFSFFAELAERGYFPL